MASIRKVDGKWSAEVRAKGVYRSKRFDTKSMAQEWAFKVEQSLGKHGGVVFGNTLKDACERYMREETKKKKGWRWEDLRLKKLCRHPIVNTQMMDLTTDALNAWVEDRRKEGVADASIKRDLQLIGAMLSCARKRWKWMSENIMLDVEKPKSSPPRDRLITTQERERILLALNYEEDEPINTPRRQIATAMLLALETGMRQGEIWGMRWDHVHPSYVVLPDTKNGTSRKVPLSSRAVALLDKMRGIDADKVFTCSQASAGTIYRRAVALAQIKGLTFHDLRHSAITSLAKKLSVLELARMVGHKDLRSLNVYYNETAEELAKKLG